MSKVTHTRARKAEDAALAVIEHGLDTSELLAHDIGRSVKTARTRLDHAVMLGLLTKHKRPTPTGGPDSVYYRPTAVGRKILDRAIHQRRSRG